MDRARGGHEASEEIVEGWWGEGWGRLRKGSVGEGSGSGPGGGGRNKAGLYG